MGAMRLGSCALGWGFDGACFVYGHWLVVFRLLIRSVILVLYGDDSTGT
jgi:hypothetical protein